MARQRLEISNETYDRVLEYLGLDGSTKKVACEMLGINYNTKRLNQLLEDYVEGIERDKRIRAQKRKEPVKKEEVINMITDYLSGASIAELSETYYRSAQVINYHIEKHGAKLRSNDKIDELNPPMLPDECVAETFEIGEFVWSAKYGSVARICAKYKNAYRIKVVNESMNQYAYQPAYELGSLKHLSDLGVNVAGLVKGAMSDDEIILEINASVRAANKRKK
jgi:hypothetical protein